MPNDYIVVNTPERVTQFSLSLRRKSSSASLIGSIATIAKLEKRV
ncbi:MAG: hypothetical protein QUS12_07905 [Methanosarcina sp.]|nr:hypothetical protein [Methanosarcina sp.]